MGYKQQIAIENEQARRRHRERMAQWGKRWGRIGRFAAELLRELGLG